MDQCTDNLARKG